MTDEEKIKEIEEEIQKTPYHKATQHHIGKLKAKLSRLREAAGKKGGGGGIGYAVKKTGDATVVLVGFPSVGKSSLLNLLTNAASPVAAYEFTTLTTVPGMMKYRGAQLQLLDIPGLVGGAAEGKGRGKEVLSVVRNCDLILMIVDSRKPEQAGQMERELYAGGIRINTKKPDVKIKRKGLGGIRLSKTSGVDLTQETAREILNEYGIHNADVLIRQKITIDELVDVVSKNRVYIPALTVFNKCDLARPPKQRDSVVVSATDETNIDGLRTAIFEKLSLIRIYMKPQGKPPDCQNPLVVKTGSTIRDVCQLLHRQFEAGFRYAVISGPSAKFDNQKVGIRHRLRDEDVLTLITQD